MRRVVDNRFADAGVLAYVIIFVIMMGLMSYYTMGVSTVDGRYEGLDGEMKEYKDPISNFEKNEGQIDATYNRLTSRSRSSSWVPFGAQLDLIQDVYKTITLYICLVWDFITFNIAPVAELGMIGVAMTAFVWITFVYVFVKLVPFVG